MADRTLYRRKNNNLKEELAEYLKLNEKTAYRLASEGKLPGFKVGGSWRFKRVDLEKWIEDKKNNKES